MRHLSRGDLLTLLEAEPAAPATDASPLKDGSTANAASQHLATCRRCRDELASLHSVLREVQQGRVPDPSPLFWEHFPQRVSAALEVDDAATGATAFAWRKWWGATAVAAMTVVLVAAVLLGGRRPAVDPVDSLSLDAAAQADLAMDDDTPWMLVEALAADLALDDVERAGFVIASGSAERAAAELTLAEHVELVRLLEEEIHR